MDDRPAEEAQSAAVGHIIHDVNLVLDTDVVVAALRSPAGASAALLGAARKGRVTLLASVALALEYEAVCDQAEHRLAAGLSQKEVEIFLAAVIAWPSPWKRTFCGGPNSAIQAMRWSWKRPSTAGRTPW